VTPERVIVIGGGGHARVVVATLLLQDVPVVGFVEPDSRVGNAGRLPVPWLGADDALSQYPPETVVLANGVGSSASMSLRAEVFRRLKKAGYRFCQVIHPAAIVASGTALGEGVQIMAGAIVQSGCRLAEDVLVNTGAVVDHDSAIGAHSHVASGAVLSGSVTLEQEVHVGCGATIIQGVRVGSGALVAAGSVVIADVGAAARVAGVPAQAIG
jgi:UDP-perosamine 4-acetyltransferase